jgi:hypothetical protein
MKVLGVDPGLVGGRSVVEVIHDAAPVLLACVDIPVIGGGAKERVDLAANPNFAEAHRPTQVVIERAGAIEAVITLCSIPVEIVEASAWKRFWHLPGKDKEGVCQKALHLFRAAHDALARKRDHGRAEATLISLYGARR